MVQTISKEQLKSKIEQNGHQVQIVNVLDPQYYHLGMIKASKKIPLSELANRLEDLDKNKEVVTYCANGRDLRKRKRRHDISYQKPVTRNQKKILCLIAGCW